MAIIKSGKPAVVAAGSVPLGQAITETSPNDVSITTIIGNILSEFADGAAIVIDPHTGKVYAASAAGVRNALVGACEEDNSVSVFVPDAGQIGRSLTFNKVAGGQVVLPNEAEITTAVKPKFTAESIVSKILALMGQAEAVDPATAGQHLIVIDQVNKQVKVVEGMLDPAVTRAALEAVVLNAGEAIKITLTPEIVESSVSLPFEGGAV